MFKKSYKGRRIKLAVKKSLAVPVAIVTSFIVILAVSLSPLVNKGLVNAFSDSVIPTPSTTSTTSESTADLVKSTEVSSSKENKEKVEESKAQSETMTETVGASEKPQSESATTASIDATFTQNNGAASSVAASTTGNGSVIISNGNTAGEIGSYAAVQKHQQILPKVKVTKRPTQIFLLQRQLLRKKSLNVSQVVATQPKTDNIMDVINYLHHI